MLKIQRATDGTITVLIVSGRLGAENISELRQSLDTLPEGNAVALDLADLLLADREAVRFLRPRGLRANRASALSGVHSKVAGKRAHSVTRNGAPKIWRRTYSVTELGWLTGGMAPMTLLGHDVRTATS